MKTKKIELEICFDDTLYNTNAINFYDLDKTFKDTKLVELISNYLHEIYNINNCIGSIFELKEKTIETFDNTKIHTCEFNKNINFSVILKDISDWENKNINVKDHISKLKNNR